MMRVSGALAVMATAFGSAFVSAQAPSAGPSVIRVTGRGEVKTPPDAVTIDYSLRGEGRTSDEAVRALVAKQRAAETVLTGRAQVRTGKLAIEEARAKACDGNTDEGSDRPRLSTGACAVIGYIATLGVTAKVAPIEDAGALSAAVASAGGVSLRVDDFGLNDPEPAKRAAVAMAIADARRQAEAIAAASGAKLGRLRRVEDPRASGETGQDVVVTGSRVTLANAVPLQLSPAPIETEANLVVEYEIGTAP